MPTLNHIHPLTANNDPEEVWTKVTGIVKKINSSYDVGLVHEVYKDVLRLFNGQYPGYSAIRTPYHDLYHTLDVLICAVRLMHGVHVSGNKLTDQEITLVMLATMLHDIGYGQLIDEEFGTGAQYTLTHVDRGIEFMQKYVRDVRLPLEFSKPLACLMNSTNPGMDFDDINFPDGRTRLLGQIVGSADIVGQMADRTYLEKLLFLYLEFKEAKFGNYDSIHDLLCKTKNFYDVTRSKKLEGSYENIYQKFGAHFKAYTGQDINYYVESIDKNIGYLSKVIALNEAEFHTMLKRGGRSEVPQSLKSISPKPTTA